MAVKIIYEDKDILVCEKPAGLAVQSARISEPDMVSELKNYLTGKQSAARPANLRKSRRLAAPDSRHRQRRPSECASRSRSIWVSCTGSTSRFPVFWFLPKIKKLQVR